MSVSAHTDASLDERNHTPGALRVETRMNWFGGSQKLRAFNRIQEPVPATPTLPIPSRDIAQLVFQDINCNETSEV